MFATLEIVRRGGKFVLWFASENYANDFLVFLEMYSLEAGSEYRYVDYFHYDQQINKVDTLIFVRGVCVRLDILDVIAMSAAICDVRRALPPCVPERWVDDYLFSASYIPMIGVEKGAISFQFSPEELPQRIVPSVRDLVRIVHTPMGHPEYLGKIMRVKNIEDNQVYLVDPNEHIGIVSQGVEAYPREYAEIVITTNIEGVMKIYGG